MSNDYFDAQTGEMLSETELDDRYDAFLDEAYPSLQIAGIDYLTSRALREVDPTAYRCGFNDWLDSELGESLFDFEAAETSAREVGAERGHSVGSWVIEGNTSVESAQAILDGFEAGDPQVLDMEPSPLSGEWADAPTSADVLETIGVKDVSDHIEEALLKAYEEGFSEGYWEEVTRAAKAVTG